MKDINSKAWCQKTEELHYKPVYEMVYLPDALSGSAELIKM